MIPKKCSLSVFAEELSCTALPWNALSNSVVVLNFLAAQLWWHNFYSFCTNCCCGWLKYTTSCLLFYIPDVENQYCFTSAKHWHLILCCGFFLFLVFICAIDKLLSLHVNTNTHTHIWIKNVYIYMYTQCHTVFFHQSDVANILVCQGQRCRGHEIVRWQTRLSLYLSVCVCMCMSQRKQVGNTAKAGGCKHSKLPLKDNDAPPLSMCFLLSCSIKTLFSLLLTRYSFPPLIYFPEKHFDPDPLFSASHSLYLSHSPFCSLWYVLLTVAPQPQT